MGSSSITSTRIGVSFSSAAWEESLVSVARTVSLPPPLQECCQLSVLRGAVSSRQVPAGASPVWRRLSGNALRFAASPTITTHPRLAYLLPRRIPGGPDMIDLRRILVATDFGETSIAALRYGVDLTRRFHAELYLFHAIDHLGEASEAEYPIGLLETTRNAAHERLRQLLSSDDLRHVEPLCAIRLGVAADEIVRYADEWDIDLIVMGTHGREGVMRAVIGSVAEKVVRRATCPVLTVHHAERELVSARDLVGVAVPAAA
jgi:nucleotide-binding universal stress UspA family protein